MLQRSVYQNAEREIKSLIDKSKFDTDPKWQNFLAVVQNNVAIEMTARGQYDRRGAGA